MSKFFIDRPVFAWVIAIVIMLAGLLSIFTLPIEQYPKIAPPAVSIRANYPGASAETLENSVTQIIEQQMIGIDYLRYFSSSSDSSGNVEITLTFEPEANPDIAQVQVQNKLQAALPLLPQEVQQQGVRVTKVAKGFLLVAGFYSKDGKVSQYELSDYVNSKILDPVARVAGVGSLNVFGEPYAMRIWLNPDKMNNFKLLSSEIVQAIRIQNADVSAGQLGGMPAVKGQQINATISAQSRLQTVQDFEKILLRVNPDGSQIRLKDVARVELGIQNYDTVSRYNGKPAIGMSVTLATGANALDTARLVKEKIAQLAQFMPAGVEVVYPYDTTPFVKLSIQEVIKTLIEAIILVVLVMYVFLQNIRATLIPTIAVPVVLLGTFGVLAAFGFTINTLTMFAVVLAIGLLVDDAIVVVENVERVMREEKLSPKEATYKSMQQITGALIGIAVVLTAVFIPMAFFKGSTGIIYKQFSITIASAMILSVIVALILTPTLCATLLKPHHEQKQTGFFGWFNRQFEKNRNHYKNSVVFVTQKTMRFLLIYGIVIGGLLWLFPKIPTAFLPNEDQGVMFIQLSTPEGATTERTLESIKKVEDYFLVEEKDSVDSIFTVSGFSFAGRGQNMAIGFAKLKDWSQRGEGQTVFELSERAMMRLSSIKDAMVFAFFPPPVLELGNASGFDIQLTDEGGVGHKILNDAKNQMLGMASQNPKLMGVRPNGLADTPQYKIDIDHEKASALGLSIADINQTLQTAWGPTYVNDFLNQGRVKKVYMQGDAEFRMLPEDMNKWYVRNNKGDMVPFSSFSTSRWEYGAAKLERYNGLSSQQIIGSPAMGVSSGEAMMIVEALTSKLPQGIGYAWTGMSYEERSSGSQTLLLYGVSLLVVFLCLAALYESWAIPFSIMLIVPLGVIGAVTATLWGGMSNDVYFQVGLLTTIGLTAKNAILIVEFAKDLYQQGNSLLESAIVASEQRLRPILMTSIAFILGVLPLAIASGAGSASQNAIGIGVIGGMLTATFLAIFFVPLFFVLVMKYFSKNVHSSNKEAHHVV